MPAAVFICNTALGAMSLYHRERLAMGVAFAGPAVILQQDTTTIAPPDTRLVVDAGGNLLIHVGS